jgi:hypothetical protein
MINGTPARERFIARLKGVTDESLIENAIRKLDAVNSRVVFLDVAKQNTENGLAFTLFANFLKSLGFGMIYMVTWSLIYSLTGNMKRSRKKPGSLGTKIGMN